MSNYDVLVIGGGAAGLTAAVVLLRAGRTVAVVDAGAPRNAPAAAMHGYLSRDSMPPRDLIAAGQTEVAGYGGTIIYGTVVDVQPGFRALLATSTEVGARKILIATGLRDEIPNIPGVRERWGQDLLHCPYCHGYEVRDQPLGVLGGDSEAVQHALLVRQWSSDVTLFTNGTSPTPEQREVLAARGVVIMEEVVARLVVFDDRLHGVELVDGALIPRSAVFVRPRFVPNSDLLTALGCDTDDNGWVTHAATGRTSVAGVWVAGNVADPRAQVITAAGQGSTAAIAINAELVEEDIAFALATHRAANPDSSGQ